MARPRKEASVAWREKAVTRARIMSRVKWTPVADGMPNRKKGARFEKGVEYTGVPYSSVQSVGRYIGFDIFLKTFLAAVENPESVVYTESLAGKLKNAACYYGKVCSSYTSYALGCATWRVSRRYTPPFRRGIVLAALQSAQGAEPGDIIFTPPQPGSHVELVTEVVRNGDGEVTHVRVEDSYPPTTRHILHKAAEFDAHIGVRGRRLYRITDLDAWRESDRAESFLFPNYAEDAAAPRINRVLLLDRGDWVPYHKHEPVKINVMDRDGQGVKALVIKCGDAVVETIERPGKGVVQRFFSTCGHYTAHCVMRDGAPSQACEFSVCSMDFTSVGQAVLGEPLEIGFAADNINIIFIHLVSNKDSYGRHSVFLTEQDRQKRKVTIPASLVRYPGRMQIWLVGENRHGRLKVRRDTTVK